MQLPACEIAISAQELQAHIVQYLDYVKSGATVLIVEGGKPIGKLVPVSAPSKDRLADLIDAGLVAWNREGLQPIAPIAQLDGDYTVADLLLEDRV